MKIYWYYMTVNREFGDYGRLLLVAQTRPKISGGKRKSGIGGFFCLRELSVTGRKAEVKRFPTED